MKIVVHRGSHEIGGSCIEVIAGTTRILFDAGLPLDPATPQSLPTTLQPGRLNGIFLTHAHCDHTGLLAKTPRRVPIWMTAETSKMVLAGALFARQPSIARSRIRTMKPEDPVTIGEMTVRAYPVDHSIFGAVAFLIEADGKRVLYTGDLRMHGRKPGMTRRLVRAVAGAPIDALVIEGTRLGSRAAEPNRSESDLESELVADFRVAPGAVLAMYSPLNVDRFVTIYRATIRSGRALIIDPYQAFVLHLVDSPKLPDPLRSDRVKVMVAPRFAWSGAARRLAHTRWLSRIQAGGFDARNVRAHPERYVVLYRDSMRDWLWPQGLPESVTCLFSYWPGYMREERQRQLEREVQAAGGRFIPGHASGHGHPDDLSEFVKAVSPRMLIPVHSSSPQEWGRRWPTVHVAEDGTDIEIHEQ